MVKKKEATIKPEQQSMSEDTRTIIAVLALLFAYPVGVIIMWFMTKWPKRFKFLITVPLILILMIIPLIVFVSFNSTIEKSKIAEKKAYCLSQCGGNLKNEACINACMKNKRSNNYGSTPTPEAH